MSVDAAPQEIGSEVRGRCGILTLNRPSALNALNLAMVERLETLLGGWASRPLARSSSAAAASAPSAPAATCARMAVRMVGRHDFAEGVRAVLVEGRCA